MSCENLVQAIRRLASGENIEDLDIQNIEQLSLQPSFNEIPFETVKQILSQAGGISVECACHIISSITERQGPKSFSILESIHLRNPSLEGLCKVFSSIHKCPMVRDFKREISKLNDYFQNESSAEQIRDFQFEISMLKKQNKLLKNQNRTLEANIGEQLIANHRSILNRFDRANDLIIGQFDHLGNQIIENHLMIEQIDHLGNQIIENHRDITEIHQMEVDIIRQIEAQTRNIDIIHSLPMQSPVENRGLFYKLFKKNLCRVSSSSTYNPMWGYNDCNIILQANEKGYYFYTMDQARSWIKLELLKGSIRPSGCLICSYKGNPQIWTLHGRNLLNARWEMLLDINQRMNDNETRVFAFENGNRYTAFKITQHGQNTYRNNHLYIRSLDILGVYFM